MTKTLTEDWKAGKLKIGKEYYIKTVYNEVLIDCYEEQYDESHYPQGVGFDNFSKNMIKSVLALVPTYDEYKAMQSKLADQRAELESSRWYQTVQNEDIGKLHGLLKDIALFFEECNPHDFTVVADNMDIYLTRIKAALNETQANSIADIKIQESEER